MSLKGYERGATLQTVSVGKSNARIQVGAEANAAPLSDNHALSDPGRCCSFLRAAESYQSGLFSFAVSNISRTSIMRENMDEMLQRVRDYVFQTDEALKESQRTGGLCRDGAVQLETTALKEIR
jgi:hypothetical protein